MESVTRGVPVTVAAAATDGERDERRACDGGRVTRGGPVTVAAAATDGERDERRA